MLKKIRPFQKNIIIYLALFYAIMIVNSCGPNERQIFNNSKELVNNYFLEAELSNFKKVVKIYPLLSSGGESFSKNILSSVNKVEFIDVKFSRNDKTEVRVVVEISIDKLDINEKVEFFIEIKDPNDIDSYKIKNTDGLFIPELRNIVERDNLFTLLKKSGKFNSSYSDYDKSSVYNKYLKYYQPLVNEVKSEIEKKLIFNKDKSDLNISNSFGYKSVNGSITIDNTNNLTIPAFNYNFLLHLFKNGKKVYTHEFFNDRTITQNSSITSKSYELTLLPSNFNKYSSEVQITNEQFLNNYIISNPRKSMSKLERIWNLSPEGIQHKELIELLNETIN